MRRGNKLGPSIGLELITGKPKRKTGKRTGKERKEQMVTLRGGSKRP